MKKIKLGIVGCGGIFRCTHLPAILEHGDEFEIVAVCDVIKERMNIEGISDTVKKYENYIDLVNDEEVEAVDICTPNYYHSVISVLALEKGKHVLCEKPDAVSVAEMKKMIDAEKRSGKVMMVMRNCRYLPASKYFKNYVDSGGCGEIYCGKCGYLRRRGIPGKGGWFTTKALSGGGPLVDLGVHMLDLALYLMGNPKAVSVSGCTYNKFSETTVSDSENSKFGDKKEDGIFDVEDLAMGFVRFENGACLQLEFSWASNIEKEEFFVELRGTKSGIRFSSDDAKNVIWTERNGVLEDVYPKTVRKSGHGDVVKNFADAINGKAKPDYTTEQGMNIIKIFEGFYKSAETGKEILL